MNDSGIPVFDGHNDLPWEARARRHYSVEGIDQELPQTLQTDIPKLRRGRYMAQFWSAYVHSDYQGGEAVIATLEQIDFIRRMCERYPRDFMFARTADDVRRARHQDRIASLIGIEGGHQIADNLAVLRQYAALGVRYMTLTWNKSTEFADAAVGERLWQGLNDRGRQVVKEMNRIGMLVDLAHVSAETMRDALETSSLPVMFSHSSCFAINPHPRNVPEDVQRMLVTNGGVQMITFVPVFVSEELWQWHLAGEHGPRPRVTVEMIADHVECARDVLGVDHIGVGGDFDGDDMMPEGMSDVGCYQQLFDILRHRGWSERDLHKLGWENALRVLQDSDSAYRSFISQCEDTVA
jgi:membrane dipeptidase